MYKIKTEELRFIPSSLDLGSAIRWAERVHKKYGVFCHPLGSKAPKGVSAKYPDWERFDRDIQTMLHPPKDSVLIEEPERTIPDAEWLADLPDLTTVPYEELQDIGYILQEMIDARGGVYHEICEVDPYSVDPLTPEELQPAIDWLKARPDELPEGDAYVEDPSGYLSYLESAA